MCDAVCRRVVLMSVMLIGLLLAGCNSTYIGGYDYQPRPVDLEVGQGARMLLTINGIRRGEKDGLGDAVEAVIRIENDRGAIIHLDPRGITLTTANLLTLDASRVEPPGPQAVPVGGTMQWTAWFELPRGEGQTKARLDGLSLRVVVQRGEDTVTRTATFSLDRPEYRRNNVGFGVGIGVGL